MPASRLASVSGLDAAALFAPLADFESVGLAVSGGPDSLALMLLAQRLGPEKFVVYTVDHGLRPEAAGEAAMVLREADRLGFRARALRWDGRKPTTGISAAARQARYRLIGAAMAQDGVPVLATAHHLHDQAETVLMRMAHASGLAGLRGMDLFAAVEGVMVARPLLGIDPAKLSALVTAAGLTATADPSNGDTDYERVRWRQMLPQLGALGLTPERISLLALRLRDADEALNVMAAQAFLEAAQTRADGKGTTVPANAVEVDIEAAPLRALPRAIAIRVVQRALVEVGGGAKPHALAAVELLTDHLRSAPVAVTLHGCTIRSDAETIRIAREPLKGARGRAATRHEGVTRR